MPVSTIPTTGEVGVNINVSFTVRFYPREVVKRALEMPRARVFKRAKTLATLKGFQSSKLFESITGSGKFAVSSIVRVFRVLPD
jgi:hypothetical protein